MTAFLLLTAVVGVSTGLVSPQARDMDTVITEDSRFILGIPNSGPQGPWSGKSIKPGWDDDDE